jgi:hypothetical protein
MQHTFQFSEQYTFSWTLLKEFIMVRLEVSYKSWIGIGWHCMDCPNNKADRMTFGDFVVGIFDGNGQVNMITILLRCTIISVKT